MNKTKIIFTISIVALPLIFGTAPAIASSKAECAAKQSACLLGCSKNLQKEAATVMRQQSTEGVGDKIDTNAFAECGKRCIDEAAACMNAGNGLITGNGGKNKNKNINSRNRNGKRNNGKPRCGPKGCGW